MIVINEEMEKFQKGNFPSGAYNIYAKDYGFSYHFGTVCSGIYFIPVDESTKAKYKKITHPKKGIKITWIGVLEK